MQNKKTALVWFTNNLRVNDNICLSLATQNYERVIGLYCFNPLHFKTDAFGFKKTERFRAQFLRKSVENLKQNLLKLNISLLIYYDYPNKLIPKICSSHDIDSIYVQKEFTAEEDEIILKVKNNISSKVTIFELYDQFLFHPEDIPFTSSEIPQVFSNFRKVIEKTIPVRPESTYIQKPFQNRIKNTTTLPPCKALGISEHITHPKSAFPFKGGETEALNRITDYFFNSKKLGVYKKTRNGLVGTDYSSKLSAWLANGSISAKTIYYNVKAYEKEFGSNQSTYWLIFELIWRDFFKYIACKHGTYIFKQEGILKTNYNWKTDTQLIKQWINGETASDFVNANMIELKKTGWMSNRGRQNVASFFAKELHLDWRIGAAYFESLLIDYDVHSNYGNWMYVAGVGNDPRDRKFNVTLQAQRYDNAYKFRKLWLQNTLF